MYFHFEIYLFELNMESNEWRLSDAELLESFATLAWAKNNNVDIIQTVLTARVG